MNQTAGTLTTASGLVFVVAPLLYTTKQIVLASYIPVAVVAFLGFALAIVGQSIRIGPKTVGIVNPDDIAYMLSRLRGKEAWVFWATWPVGIALFGLGLAALVGAKI